MVSGCPVPRSVCVGDRRFDIVVPQAPSATVLSPVNRPLESRPGPAQADGGGRSQIRRATLPGQGRARALV